MIDLKRDNSLQIIKSAMLQSKKKHSFFKVRNIQRHLMNWKILIRFVNPNKLKIIKITLKGAATLSLSKEINRKISKISKKSKKRLFHLKLS